MSDDRFKQARRSLINRQGDGDEEQSDPDPKAGDEGEEEFADEKTMLVDLDSLEGGQQGDKNDDPSGGSDGRGANRGGRTNRGGGRSRDGRRQNRGGSDQSRRRNNDSGRRGSSRSGARNRNQDDRSGNQSQNRQGGARSQNRSSGSQPPEHPGSQKDASGHAGSGNRQQHDRQRGQNQRGSRQQDNRKQDNRQQHGQRPNQHSQGGRQQHPNQPPQGGQPPSTPSRGGPNADDSTDTLSGPSGAGLPGDNDNTRPQARSAHQEGSLDDAGASSSGQQVFVPGDDEGAYDEKTAFVNLNDFADEEPENSTFAPEEEQAGHEGSTQFVDINSLVGSDEAASPGPADPNDVSNDEVLHQGYDFTDNDVQRGEITLIRAENALGKSVILRQIWAGPAREMPTQMRQRINELDQVDIDHLMGMNGMVISQTGCWVELERPQGRRMSTIIRQQGPQDEERVLGWIEQIGEALHQLHDDYELVYGNLTPDAVWIDDEDNALLESFDLACLEDRDDLGPYGPPELKVHPDSRTLSPATDVYCLAAVTLAGLTGVPLDPRKVGSIDSKRVTNAVREAVIDAPRDRTQTVRKFLDRLVGSSFSFRDLVGEFDIDGQAIKAKLSEAEPIHLAMGAMVVGILVMGGYWLLFKGGSAPAPKTTTTAQARQPAPSQESVKEPVAQPPGVIQNDERVIVRTSFRQNPPADAKKKRSDSEMQSRIDELRSKAQANISEAQDLEGSNRRDRYKAALEAVTEAVRLQDGKASATDRNLLKKLYAKESIQKYYDKLVERLEKDVETGSISEARFPYRQLAAISPDSTARNFFENLGTVNVTSLDRKKSEDDDGKD